MGIVYRDQVWVDGKMFTRELDAVDMAAEQEGRAVDRHRRMRRETMDELGIAPKMSKSVAKRKGMTRGAQAARERAGSISMPVRQLVGKGPLGKHVRLSGLREDA